MKTQPLSGLLVTIAAGFLLVACEKTPRGSSDSEARAVSLSPSAASTRIYEIDGGEHAHSRVTRTVFNDASERLQGETEVEHASVRTKIIEDVEIDPSGRLASAVIAIEEIGGGLDNKAKQNVVFEPKKGLVSTSVPGGIAVSWSAPTDEPWVYAPVSSNSPISVPIATPVCAWVALRGAQASRTPRVVNAIQMQTHVSVADQLVVVDGKDSFILVGDDVFQADNSFVLSWRADKAPMTERCASSTCSPTQPPT